MIKNMHLSWVSVSDIEKAKEFFVEKLGLKLAHEDKDYEWLSLLGKEGGMYLGVGKGSKEKGLDAGHNAVITMTVDDIIAVKSALEKKGVVFLSDIVEVPGHIKLAMFQDNDGNKFQLAQHG